VQGSGSVLAHFCGEALDYPVPDSNIVEALHLHIAAAAVPFLAQAVFIILGHIDTVKGLISELAGEERVDFERTVRLQSVEPKKTTSRGTSPQTMTKQTRSKIANEPSKVLTILCWQERGVGAHKGSCLRGGTPIPYIHPPVLRGPPFQNPSKCGKCDDFVDFYPEGSTASGAKQWGKKGEKNKRVRFSTRFPFTSLFTSDYIR
jgi:hypothetical protein